MTSADNTSPCLGLDNAKVILTQRFADWKIAFDEESLTLRNSLDYPELQIQHIGSTAIQGVDAKPILDIMLGIESYEDGNALIGDLESLGYTYKVENAMPGRHFFVKYQNGLCTHHIHMVSQYSNFWKAHLLFRDFLRENESDRLAYAELKRNLAEKFPCDRAAYTQEKAAFIEAVLKKSGYQPILD